MADQPKCPAGVPHRVPGRLFYIQLVQQAIWSYISGRVNFSRNFRAPTLNERYWQPGGNPDLEPEESYNIEAGITL